MIIVAKWGFAATGRFFRIIYSGELWLTRAQAQAAVCSGFNMIESCMQAWCKKCAISLFHFVSTLLQWEAFRLIIDICLGVLWGPGAACSIAEVATFLHETKGSYEPARAVSW